ncbi:MAG: flagellar motor protein MotB, partial [Pseudomonadota bacterium]
MGKKKEGGGAPGWIVTFADLMSLLLTFFVLLLSFAEMDVVKFKKAVGSIRNAFGVQSDGQYIDFVTSNNPFQQDFAQGAVQIEDYDFPQPQLAPDFENFCELEQQRIKRDEVELKTMGIKITEALAKNGSDAYRILDGTNQNCAGGPTTWNTWLSCEEIAFGRVYEC